MGTRIILFFNEYIITFYFSYHYSRDKDSISQYEKVKSVTPFFPHQKTSLQHDSFVTYKDKIPNLTRHKGKGSFSR